jgi:hypothetical protein
MNALINRLQPEESINPSCEIGQLDVVAFQQSNLRNWVETDSEGMFSFVEKNKTPGVLQKQNLMAAILLTYQINSVPIDSARKFHIYYDMMVATEKLNFPNISTRFGFPKYDSISGYDAPFINRVDSSKIGKEAFVSKNGRRVTEAPIWLVKRMETLQRMQPPTSEEVDTQLKASAEARKKLTSRLPVSLNGQRKQMPS